MVRVESADKSFYAVFEPNTALEQLDIDISEDDSEAYVYASEVASCVTDWNGHGTVDPLWLMSDRKNHKYIYMVSRAIDRVRPPLPKITISDEGDCLYCKSKDFYATIRNFTVLEFMDLIGQVRKLNKDEERSFFKCLAIESVLIDWNGLGKLKASQLYDDKKHHPYVVAIDSALSDFFRGDAFTLSEDFRILDDSNNNGGHDPEPPSVEPTNNVNKGFSFNVERIPRR
jgi:hypothetical protein